MIGACLGTFKAMNWDVRVAGIEHIPTIGGGVVATNHIGYLDFVFAGYGVREQGKRRLRFVAKREVFDNTFAGPLMRAMRHIPVDRGGDTHVAMSEVADALTAGDLVGMFPEGTINKSFVPFRGRPGAARMAMGVGVPLIPGAVWGTQRIYTKGRKPQAARGAVVCVTFGPPIPYTADDDPLDVHTQLMAAIGGMVEKLQSDYPQAPSGPDDTWWLPAHLGGTAPTVDEAQAEAAARAKARREQRSREA